MVICEILTSEAEVELVADEWRELQLSAGRIPFTDYDFYDAWWRHIGKPECRTPYIVTGRDKGKLVAILPLSIQHKKDARILQGVGVEAFYLCDSLQESSEHAKILWEAARQSRGYDFAVIKEVDPDSACGDALTSFARPFNREKSPYLDIPWSDSNAWLASLSSHTRGENKRRLRRLQDKGVQYFTHTSNPVPVHILDEMIRQRRVWCAENDKHGLFELEGASAFFYQLSTTAADQGQLFLSWLQHGDRLVACFLGFRHRETFYFKTIGYDPAWAHFSPGNLIMVNAISWAIDNGCRRLNFGLGAYAYKLRYTNNIKEYVAWTFSASRAGRLMEWRFIGHHASREWLYRRWKAIERYQNANVVMRVLCNTLDALRRSIKNRGQKRTEPLKPPETTEISPRQESPPFRRAA